MAEDGAESSEYRHQLQKAIEESLTISSGAVNPDRPMNSESEVCFSFNTSFKQIGYVGGGGICIRFP